jgi:hypothetical protein
VNRAWGSAVAHRLGVHGDIAFTPARVGQTLHVPCSRKHIVDVTVPMGFHPDGIAKRMLSAGWTIGRKLVCPDCQRKPKETKMVMTLVPDPAGEEPKPTPAAGRARRLVYMALEDYYDEAAKQYKPGHSDASIADDCGVAAALVKTIREESYGPLAEPSEVAALRAELVRATALAKEGAEELGRQIKQIETNLDRLARKNGWLA